MTGIFIKSYERKFLVAWLQSPKVDTIRWPSFLIVVTSSLDRSFDFIQARALNLVPHSQKFQVMLQSKLFVLAVQWHDWLNQMFDSIGKTKEAASWMVQSVEDTVLAHYTSQEDFFPLPCTVNTTLMNAMVIHQRSASMTDLTVTWQVTCHYS